MRYVTIDGGLAELSREDCLSRLATTRAGRIALSMRSLPAILPVSYCLDGDDVLVSAAAKPHVLAAVYDNIVTFQVDDVDPESGERWSVSVTGIARPATAVTSRILETPSPNLSTLTARIHIDMINGTQSCHTLAPSPTASAAA
jgi:hypothetical protein